MSPHGHPRPACSADVTGLAHLAARSFPLACPPGLDQTAIDRHIEARLSVEVFATVLQDRAVRLRILPRSPQSSSGPASVGGLDQPGPLSGYVMLREDDPHPDLPVGRWLLLERIYVDPVAIGTGAGHELMLDAQRIAAEDGFDGLWLGTNKQNARALRFYCAHGFEIVGERVFLVGDVPNSDWVLVWRVARD